MTKHKQIIIGFSVSVGVRHRVCTTTEMIMKKNRFDEIT